MANRGGQTVKHTIIRPKTAVREEKRQANEALGRSFCKTLAELVTNSDSSAKRKHGLPHGSGLIDLMLKTSKGTQLDTAALRSQLDGKHPLRRIAVEVVTARGHGRSPNEIVVIDEAEGMSADALQTALEDIAGDRRDLAGNAIGRNLFGRGLSDVMRAHREPEVQTYDGKQLSIARGRWSDRWEIDLGTEDSPQPRDFKDTFITPASTGTAVRFVAVNPKFRLPQQGYIISRLANFFMLRLIAADPNVELTLRQFRAAGNRLEDRVTYDFPVGQVIEPFTRTFDPGGGQNPLTVDFLLVRSERRLEGLGTDRDTRENGLLIVDELDAVYDLTFVDPDYEKAEFLRHIFGIVRVNGLRSVLEAYLNSPDFPTSPLRIDREGFNRDHEFSRALLDFLAEELRPCYERERKRLEDREHDKLSAETRKRIDDALKHLNRYFQQITEKAGPGQGAEDNYPEPPTEPVSFFPRSTKLWVGHPRRVLLLIRDDVVTDGCELVATATEGFIVQPEMEIIYRKTSPRWSPHPNFFCIPFLVTGGTVGQQGTVASLVDCADGQTVEAVLRIEDVLEEPMITPPATMEFRPSTAMGHPNRRNSLILYVNPQVIPAGHYVRFTIVKHTGAVQLIDATGAGVEQLEVKLDSEQHAVRGQNVFRVRVPWRGTAWNQNAVVEARVKVGPQPIIVQGHIRLDEPDPNEGGFFREVKYDELDSLAPSVFAGGIITVNMLDLLNKQIFGTGATKEEAKKEFDRRLSRDPQAQQRLAWLLLEELSFRTLQQLFDDNKLPLPSGAEISSIHEEIDKHKFKLAADIYKAMVR
jgi:hypothetical protein